jgi:hypothetical protein
MTYTIQHTGNAVYAVLVDGDPDAGIAVVAAYDDALALAMNETFDEYADLDWYTARGPWFDVAKVRNGQIVWAADDRYAS